MDITLNLSKQIPIKILTLVYLFLPRTLADSLVNLLRQFSGKAFKDLKSHEVALFSVLWYFIIRYGVKILKWIKFNIRRPDVVKREISATLFRLAVKFIPPVGRKV